MWKMPTGRKWKTSSDTQHDAKIVSEIQQIHSRLRWLIVEVGDVILWSASEHILSPWTHHRVCQYFSYYEIVFILSKVVSIFTEALR